MIYQKNDSFYTLTPREMQVMWLLCQGLPNKLCAEKLGCSVRTIETHRARIFHKLKVRNVLEMVVKLQYIAQQ